MPSNDSFDLCNQRWELAWDQGTGSPAWEHAVSARVPGCVLDDLHRAGVVPDPFHGTQFRDVAWVGETTFWYRCRVATADVEMLLHGDCDLAIQLDGVDTYAEVFWNGTSLGILDNQFLRHEFKIARASIASETNELIIRIDPVKEAFREWFENTRPETAGVWAMFDDERPWIRKAQMTFGWDNCPTLLAGGITLPLRLVQHGVPKIADLEWKVTQVNGEKRSCLLALRGSLLHAAGAGGIRIHGACQQSRWESAATLDKEGLWQTEFVINDALFWWPNGAGKPHLYDVTVTTHDAQGEAVAVETLRIGLREIRVITDPPREELVNYRIGRPSEGEHSGSPEMDGACLGPWQRVPLAAPERVEVRPFHFEINGRVLFIKGFDWQTPSVMVGTVTDAQIANIISLCVESGANMLRAWGGGAIERDAFYKLCDEKGLLLWQDFFFACALYPRDPMFLERIKPEVEDVIRRLRNHTCLAAWCGDNESDMIAYDRGDDPAANPINKELIPSALESLDWQRRYYHPSSPSGGPYPRSDFGGDKRNWGPNFPHDNYAHIRQERARFISESGMKSFPSAEVITRGIPEAMQWPLDNEMWRLHWGDLDNTVRRDYDLDTECVRHFGIAETLKERVRLSQFAQAYGTRLLIEQCRRRKGECGGILLWKSADQWPCCDQGIVDSAGVVRPVYETIKEAFAEVVVSISQGYGPTEHLVEWWIVSDRAAALRGELITAVYSLRSRTTREMSRSEISIAADEARRCVALEIAMFDPAEDILLGRFAEHAPAGFTTDTWYALQPQSAYRYHEQKSCAAQSQADQAPIPCGKETGE